MPLRDIREEHSFLAIAEKVYGSTKEADEQLDAATWALIRETNFSRYPYLGTVPMPSGPANVYIIDVAAHGGFPSLSVYFAVSACDTTIHLLDLLPATPSIGFASGTMKRSVVGGSP